MSERIKAPDRLSILQAQIEKKLVHFLNTQSYAIPMGRYTVLEAKPQVHEEHPRRYLVIETIPSGIPRPYETVTYMNVNQKEKQIDSLLKRDIMLIEYASTVGEDNTLLVFRKEPRKKKPLFIQTDSMILDVHEQNVPIMEENLYLGDPRKRRFANETDLDMIDQLITHTYPVESVISNTAIEKFGIRETSFDRIKCLQNTLASFSPAQYFPGALRDFFTGGQYVFTRVEIQSYAKHIQSLIKIWKQYPEFLTDANLQYIQNAINERFISIGKEIRSSVKSIHDFDQNFLKKVFLIAEEWQVSEEIVNGLLIAPYNNPQIVPEDIPSSIDPINQNFADEHSHLNRYKWDFIEMSSLEGKTAAYFVIKEEGYPGYKYIHMSDWVVDSEQKIAPLADYYIISNINNLLRIISDNFSLHRTNKREIFPQ